MIMWKNTSGQFCSKKVNFFLDINIWLVWSEQKSHIIWLQSVKKISNLMTQLQRKNRLDSVIEYKLNPLTRSNGGIETHLYFLLIPPD